jgi:tRNA (guanosine-2'-O-)-methyltransferase
MKEKLFTYLSQFIFPERLELFNSVVNQRTNYITVVLEDIYQPHNASAVLRSCDCFGVQNVHIIENKNEYNVNPDVALGSSQWINMHRYNETNDNTVDALKQIKDKGYRIVATTPHEKDTLIQDLDLNRGPIALLFGTEITGLTQTAINQADEFVKIPMYGFTESFNISVSAALSLYELTTRLRKSNINWELSEEEILDLKIDWIKKTVKRPELLEKRFFEDFNKK